MGTVVRPLMKSVTGVPIVHNENRTSPFFPSSDVVCDFHQPLNKVPSQKES